MRSFINLQQHVTGSKCFRRKKQSSGENSRTATLYRYKHSKIRASPPCKPAGQWDPTGAVGHEVDRMLTPHWVCTYCSILSGPDLFPRRSTTEVWRSLGEYMGKSQVADFFEVKGGSQEPWLTTMYIITVPFSQS